MIIDALNQIIGTLPVYGVQNTNQYEIVRYVIAGVVLIFMLSHRTHLPKTATRKR